MFKNKIKNQLYGKEISLKPVWSCESVDEETTQKLFPSDNKNTQAELEASERTLKMNLSTKARCQKTFLRKEESEITEEPGKISSLSLKPPAEGWRTSRNVLFTSTKEPANYLCSGKIGSCEVYLFI